MVDDQGNAFGSLSDPGNSTDADGPTDPSDPDDAELSTQIALLNGSTDSPSPTDADSQGDDATVATPGTTDWLNQGAENDPLFTDSTDQGDSEQQTGSGMVDDQGNAFGILSDPGSYDPGDTTVPDSQGDGSGATIATPGTIDWLNPGAEGSPLFDDSDIDWPSGLSIPDQPSGDVDDSNETSTEVGSSVSTTNVRLGPDLRRRAGRCRPHHGSAIHRKHGYRPDPVHPVIRCGQHGKPHLPSPNRSGR